MDGTTITDDAAVEEAEIEEGRRLPAVQASEAMIARGEVSAAEVLAQREKIQQVMASVMKKGVHYGEIPGISKPTLLKPGAEVLAVTFRLAPSYKSEKVFHDDSHLTVISAATLTHIPTGLVVSEGEGLCTSREKKYAYRGEGRLCPVCGAGAIKKSKYPPREGDYPGASTSDAPGWFCFGKVGGCGANFAADDPAIVNQEAGKVANPDLPDTWNTVLKMANKRALVAAILNGTAASDIFTQDVEDLGAAAADTHETTSSADTTTPRSWAEITAWAEPYGEALGWSVWIADAAELLFGSRVSADLTSEQRGILGQKASGAIIALRGIHDPSEFPPPSREEVQQAWASVLNGSVLPGPGWRLSPEETDLPTYAELPTMDGTLSDDRKESGESESAEDVPFEPTSAEAAEADEIPFGEPETGDEGPYA